MSASASESGRESVDPSRGTRSRSLVLPIVWGLVLLPLKIAASFLKGPVFIALDLVAFGVVSALLASSPKRIWWHTAASVAAPSLLFTTFVVFIALGPAKLSQGIGSSWLISLGTIPVSALVGAYVGFRRAAAGGTLESS